ncbi:hypothetical protein Tco_1485741 [Tanacetum coccineum]
MGDENPIRTLGDYSKPSHEGYRNTIELSVGNNVDPNQYLKDFLKLVDSLDLDGENRERTCLRRTAKLRNDVLMFQQHHGESLSEAWTHFKNLLQKVPHHGIDLWLKLVHNECSFHRLRSEDPNQYLKDFLKLVDSLDLDGSITTWEDLTTRFVAQFFPPRRTAKLRNDILIRTIDQSASGKLRDLNAEESWALLKDLALYDNKSWNDLKDFAKPVKAIALPQDVPSTSGRRLIELENQVQCLMEAHLALAQPTQVNKVTTLFLAHAPIYKAILEKYVESLELGKNGLAFVQGEVPAKMEDPRLFTLPCRLGDSKPFNTLADLGSCVGIDVKGVDLGEEEAPYWTTLGKRESCKSRPSSDRVGVQTPYYARKDFLDGHLPREWEISRDAELNPFKDTLVFRRMDKPPKNRDGAWHAKIRLIDPDGEEFTKTLQSIPTTRKLSERESPREIIDLDHFYDT